MTIRVVLVALVAVLGLDLVEVVSRVRAGREWIAASMPGLTRSESGPVVQSDREGPAIGLDSERVDLAFGAAVESMASTFTSDLASARPEPAPASLEVEFDPDSRIEKLSEAVRLTRRAVDAWSGLIQAVADPVATEDRGDSL
jgi:hypothetical protein